MVELVDTLALGASASGREGSSPFSRTKVKRPSKDGLFTLVLPDLNLHEICCSKFEVKVRKVSEVKKCLHFFMSERKSQLAGDSLFRSYRTCDRFASVL